MREIKFRAWDPERREMYIPTAVMDHGIPAYSADINLTVDVRYHPTHPLMQFTGLHDKNGKEIYEGDIVQLQTGNEDVFTAPIVYNRDEARFDLEHPEGYHGHWGLTRDIIEVCEYEIIGNIYENPELVKS